jgi:hypothetical protein
MTWRVTGLGSGPSWLRWGLRLPSPLAAQPLALALVHTRLLDASGSPSVREPPPPFLPAPLPAHPLLLKSVA